MAAHNFKLVPTKKPKIKFLSGYKEKDPVWKYHCKNCDSTVELKQFASLNEVNKYMSDPAQRFPCISVKQMEASK